MKPDVIKRGKERQAAGSKTKQVCGTLSYLAECRGMTQKAPASTREAPPELGDRIVRKFPAAL